MSVMRTNPTDRPAQSIAGFTVGIIVADESMNLLPGNVANATTFRFPVLYEVLDGIGARDIMAGNPDVIARILEAGDRLEGRGVHAIVGACGSFANYQRQAAAHFRVPTYLSVMLQLPWILSGLRQDQKVGVIAAAASALTPSVFDQCGITDPDRLVIDEAIGIRAFLDMAGHRPEFDFHALSGELSSLAASMVSEHPEVAALVLQCSDLPPFAAAIQAASRRPVFDMTSLVEWVAGACLRRNYL
jgi:hypothetical protein